MLDPPLVTRVLEQREVVKEIRDRRVGPGDGGIIG
jgi:hypothetical protein